MLCVLSLMADIKQLKIKIHSTKSIKKITNAMEIISTIKLQKIKKKADHLKEYMTTFLWMLSSIDSYKSLFTKPSKQSTKRHLAVLVSSEKWLCGSLNTLLFKQFHKKYEHQQSHVAVYAIGKKAKEFCIRRWYTVIGSMSLTDIFDSDDLSDMYELVNGYWKQWIYSDITVWYNYFRNTMKQVPVWFQLFPLSRTSFEEFVKTLEIIVPRVSSKKHTGSMKCEPTRAVIAQKAYDIMMNVILYGAILHNKTGEFAARMMAMKWAKDNATTIISDLTLAYNKARQDAITKEVLEIVSAKAVIEA